MGGGCYHKRVPFRNGGTRKKNAKSDQGSLGGKLRIRYMEAIVKVRHIVKVCFNRGIYVQI